MKKHARLLLKSRSVDPFAFPSRSEQFRAAALRFKNTCLIFRPSLYPSHQYVCSSRGCAHAAHGDRCAHGAGGGCQNACRGATGGGLCAGIGACRAGGGAGLRSGGGGGGGGGGDRCTGGGGRRTCCGGALADTGCGSRGEGCCRGFCTGNFACCFTGGGGGEGGGGGGRTGGGAARVGGTGAFSTTAFGSGTVGGAFSPAGGDAVPFTATGFGWFCGSVVAFGPADHRRHQLGSSSGAGRGAVAFGTTAAGSRTTGAAARAASHRRASTRCSAVRNHTRGSVRTGIDAFGSTDAGRASGAREKRRAQESGGRGGPGHAAAKHAPPHPRSDGAQHAPDGSGDAPEKQAPSQPRSEAKQQRRDATSSTDPALQVGAVAAGGVGVHTSSSGGGGSGGGATGGGGAAAWRCCAADAGAGTTMCCGTRSQEASIVGWGAAGAATHNRVKHSPPQPRCDSAQHLPRASRVVLEKQAPSQPRSAGRQQRLAASSTAWPPHTPSHARLAFLPPHTPHASTTGARTASVSVAREVLTNEAAPALPPSLPAQSLTGHARGTGAGKTRSSRMHSTSEPTCEQVTLAVGATDCAAARAAFTNRRSVKFQARRGVGRAVTGAGGGGRYGTFSCSGKPHTLFAAPPTARS